MRIRCFISLDLPFEVNDYIKEVQESMRKEGLFIGRFTPLENLHLTLKFLGEIDEDKVLEVKKRLSEIKFKEFEAELGEVGIFLKDLLELFGLK